MQRVALPRACCGWRALHSAAAARQQPAPRTHHAGCAPLAQHHPRLRGCTLAGSRLFRCAAADAATPLEAAALAPPPPPHFIVVDASPLLYAAHYAFEGARQRSRCSHALRGAGAELRVAVQAPGASGCAQRAARTRASRSPS
jgi:hypothetical protein